MRASLLPLMLGAAACATQSAGSGTVTLSSNVDYRAPPVTFAAGISARHPWGFYGSLRLRAISDRPADPMGVLTAQGFAIVSGQLGVRRDFWDVGLQVENVFNSTWREAQFEETSRLPNEAAPVTDIKYTAGTPFAATLRLSSPVICRRTARAAAASSRSAPAAMRVSSSTADSRFSRIGLPISVNTCGGSRSSLIVSPRSSWVTIEV